MIYDIKRTALNFFALLIITISPSIQAQLYKWVDEKGKTVYSDQAPNSDAKDQKILNKSGVKYPTENTTPASENPNPTVSEAPTPAKSTGPKTLAEKELEFRKRRAEQEETQAKAAKEQMQAKEKQEKCLQVRGSLQTLQNGGRITKYNDKGEIVHLDDNERQKEIEDAKKAAAEFCK